MNPTYPKQVREEEEELGTRDTAISVIDYKYSRHCRDVIDYQHGVIDYIVSDARPLSLRRDHSRSSETILAQARILQYSPGFHPPRTTSRINIEPLLVYIILVLNILTKHIQEPMPQSMLFTDDIVLVGHSREELNGRLEMWRQALGTHEFRISRSKIEYMECKFSKMRTNSNVEVKTEDHIMPQVTRFRYLESIIQDDGENDGDENHMIQAGWINGGVF
ncbi:hypothetical protein Lal_00001241 [Lupinus albus]|nr:hypothetical protein Lal_00001241 [Lupinus albus]